METLWTAMPRDVQRKISCYDLKRTVESLHIPVMDNMRESLRYAMQRMETIRETNPEIALDADIERCRRALDSENAEVTRGEEEARNQQGG